VVATEEIGGASARWRHGFRNAEVLVEAAGIEPGRPPGGIDASRVKILDRATVKRKKHGSELVPSETTLTAGD